ncbi:MAG: DNA oxidative demethylase AlkB [Methylotenera sp.]|uniref:DNA oxidative demethylase AlkB n=1 Tax=Methylotenera sp. TaxID=2051956 RepID=UPI0024889E80|nr:DNA oxidative demethylase AlkB [Methylotenera sp.]MDI1308810.1 DNA oxidative demethylase AlkB [Methylotenera sp.]
MDLFDGIETNKLEISNEAFLLKGYALANEVALLKDLTQVLSQAPLRHMVTKNGFAISAAMTNCGALGWVSDRQGYRYDSKDPITDNHWPLMPESFQQLAISSAENAGFVGFQPDACLINQYQVGTSMGLHQDKNELDFNQPIVSVSLGIPAVFKFCGLTRTDKTLKIPLAHGDVVVWGGQSRLNFHAIAPLKMNTHPILGAYRYNLTFRKAG